MSDREIINPRERPLSTDIMDMQALDQRTLADLMKFIHQTQYTLNYSYTLEVHDPIVYGLFCEIADVPGQTSLTVHPGVLMQNSVDLPPVPGPWDSNWRIAINRTSRVVPFPVPGADTWYLLEAQMVEVVAETSTRDVLNTTTLKFESGNVVKKKEWQISTQWVAGSSTNMPVPSGGNWVTLCGVKILTGGIGIGGMTQLQPQAHQQGVERSNWSTRPRVPTLKTFSAPNPATASDGIYLEVDECVSNEQVLGLPHTGYGGIKMRFGGVSTPLPSLTPTSATYLEPGTVLAENTLYYLYMSPWYKTAPQMFVSHNTRGVLVLSANPPDKHGFNTVALGLPAPFNAFVAPVSCAPCVGVLKRAPTVVGVGWVPMWASNGRYRFVTTLAWGFPGTGFLFTGSVSPQTVPPSLVPPHAKSYVIQTDWTITGAQAGSLSAGPADTSTLWEYSTETWDVNDTLGVSFIQEAPADDPANMRYSWSISGGRAVFSVSGQLKGFTV